MSSSEAMLSHEGVVVRIDSDRYDVVVDAITACEGCKARAYCGANDNEETHHCEGTHGREELKGKIISVVDTRVDGIGIGDRVVVRVKRRVATYAAFFAYILPLILFVLTIIFVERVVGSEGVAALVSFGVVGLYYVVIYFARLYFEQMVNFEIEKIS